MGREGTNGRREGSFQDKTEVKTALEDDAEAFNDSELLRTIKLSKNLFKMKLPKSTYEPNFQTIPGQQVIKNGQRVIGIHM